MKNKKTKNDSPADQPVHSPASIQRQKNRRNMNPENSGKDYWPVKSAEIESRANAAGQWRGGKPADAENDEEELPGNFQHSRNEYRSSRSDFQLDSISDAEEEEIDDISGEYSDYEDDVEDRNLEEKERQQSKITSTDIGRFDAEGGAQKHGGESKKETREKRRKAA